MSKKNNTYACAFEGKDDAFVNAANTNTNTNAQHDRPGDSTWTLTRFSSNSLEPTYHPLVMIISKGFNCIIDSYQKVVGRHGIEALSVL
jgi:hypothetical protein